MKKKSYNKQKKLNRMNLKSNNMRRRKIMLKILIINSKKIKFKSQKKK